MKKRLLLCGALIACASLSQAAPTLLVGTPDYFGSGLSLQFGQLINFDNLTSNTQLSPSAYLSQGVQSIANNPASDPLFALPFSQQTPPNYLSTGSSDNYAGNITITLTGLANEIGIGIASDGTPVQLIALGANGTPLGSAFTVTTSGSGSTPYNGYWAIQDSSYDIKSLQIISSANLGIDDLQFTSTPEPMSLTLLLAGVALIAIARLRKRVIPLVAVLLSSIAIHPGILSARQAIGTPATPIQHIVIIFGENISFDHYFGTYPNAVNPPGQPPFHVLAGTPSVNGLTGALLTNNPNLNSANGAGASNPFRLDRTQALTADMNHSYGPEQASFDNGLMDLFPAKTGSAGPPPKYYPPVAATTGLVMGYYDGNTVTAMWNYAQHYAMNDNSYNTQFGPSTPGALNLISGQTNGVNATLNGPSSAVVGDGNGGMTVVGDADPIGDVCSGSTKFQYSLSGRNVGDLLNAAGVSWGWFNGGFDLTITNPNGSSGCNRSTISPVSGLTEGDYVPHHQPFQYYATTANPQHTRPTSVAMIGKQGDAANHQYDLNDFYAAVSAGNFPAVSFLKASSYQDAHPGNSNPLDEQAFVAHVVNFLQQTPGAWANTAVVIAYDDSDGWYDHQMGPIVNGSATSQDALNGPGVCGNGSTALPGIDPATTHAQGRCGYGVRTPLLVISPYAKANFVDHTVTDQTSPLRFIEDNWLGGQRIGQGSFDSMANSITNMLDFTQTPNTTLYILSETTGEPQ